MNSSTKPDPVQQVVAEYIRGIAADERFAGDTACARPRGASLDGKCSATRTFPARSIADRARDLGMRVADDMPIRYAGGGDASMP
jgi:hypothetical protein